MAGQLGRQMRVRSETEKLIKRHRPELLAHGTAHAVHVLVHEALGVKLPLTPTQLKAQAAMRQQARARQKSRAKE